MPSYAVPGVYIEEQTGPGVISGVGTSTAAFIGPACNGPLNEPVLITSFDEFTRLFGTKRDDGRPSPYLYVGNNPYYLGFAVQGFFQNGGRYAYIVRVGTAVKASYQMINQKAENIFLIQAKNDGKLGNQISITTGLSASYVINNSPNDKQLILDDVTGLYSGCKILIQDTERAEIDSIDNTKNLIAFKNSLTTRDVAAKAIKVIVCATAKIINSATSKDVTQNDITTVTLDPTDVINFKPGDIVTDGANQRAAITRIDSANATVFLDSHWLTPFTSFRIADIALDQKTFRVDDIKGLYPGTVLQVLLFDKAAKRYKPGDYMVVQSVDGANFVTLASGPSSLIPTDAVAGAEPLLIPQEFTLTIIPPNITDPAKFEKFRNLSQNPYHPRYILNKGVVTSDWVNIVKPEKPPITNTYPKMLIPESVPDTFLSGGLDDQPSSLTSSKYEIGLKALNNLLDVNMVCIPDAAKAANNTDYEQIQELLKEHCVDLRNRIAILDSRENEPPLGSGSIDEHRQKVTASNGFAALYYPWLLIQDPLASGSTMLIPPSGHIAGIYARTDSERGVHKAPANTEVRGILGIERRLSDAEQGPLNLKGVNVLRILPGSTQVVVWGARTTVDPNITDWIYVNVRRLLIYIEQSLEEGIRWAVFEPNNLALWQKLKRTISEFLTRAWRDGALFGAKPEEAFYVRIDEAINPASTRALGRLYIEIGVAPVRPAEFIIVRIGLWDGGADVSEG
jgi:uncharacterized protein